MKNKNPISPSAIIKMLVAIVFIPFVPLLISSRWNWWEAWAYACGLHFRFYGKQVAGWQAISGSAG